MTILDQLKRQRGLLARCPNCSSEFPLLEADLFDATEPLLERAADIFARMTANLRDRARDFAHRKKVGPARSELASRVVNIAKVVEKIAPSLPGFPVHPGDCRSLFEPIDYIVFSGLCRRGRVEALYFVDIKSGASRLTRIQSKIKALVERGRVSLRCVDTSPGSK